jgi:hypothetical protein
MRLSLAAVAGGMAGTAGMLAPCRVERRRVVIRPGGLGALATGFAACCLCPSAGVITFESINGSLGGDGGLEEQADVGAVVWSPPIVSPSDVRELLREAQEKRAVSLRGSRRRRSVGTLMDPARVVAVELSRLERMVEMLGSRSNPGDAVRDDVWDAANERRFSLGELGVLMGAMPMLSLFESLSCCGSLWTCCRRLGTPLSRFWATASGAFSGRDSGSARGFMP